MPKKALFLSTRFSRQALAAATLALAVGAALADDFVRPGVSFALLGDVPYGTAEEPKFDRVVAAINAARNVRLVVHTGDVKQGSERCDDAVLQRRFNQYQGLADPLIVTPGDNDWTDCHRSNNGGYNPVERLTRFRQIFYPQPGRTSGGRPATVLTQATLPGHAAHGAFVENQMWAFAGATMGTVHVVGSNNNLAPWSGIDPTDTVAAPRADRLADALAWIDAIFDRAEAGRSAGVMIAMQANPAFESAAGSTARQGFNEVIDKLAARTKAFGKPVLVAHGDSHYFRLDMPLVLPTAAGSSSPSAPLENFTRVENFGSPSVHWVEVFVDARDPNVFSVVPHIVPGNVFAR